MFIELFLYIYKLYLFLRRLCYEIHICRIVANDDNVFIYLRGKKIKLELEPAIYGKGILIHRKYYTNDKNDKIIPNSLKITEDY